MSKRRLDSGAYFPVVILAEFFERFHSGIVVNFELGLCNDYDVECFSKLFFRPNLRRHISLMLGE